MDEKVIQSHEIPDGVRLVAEPFSEPNKNAACQVVSEVKFQPNKRNIRIHVANLKWMKVSDVVILINALRAMIQESQSQTSIPKKSRLTTGTKRSSTKKKATKKRETKKKPKRSSISHKTNRVKKR